MNAPFIPTPKNCTIDGRSWRATGHDFTRMEWDKAIWKTGSIWAADDPHWRVGTLIEGETERTYHRVRLKKRHPGRKVGEE